MKLSARNESDAVLSEVLRADRTIGIISPQNITTTLIAPRSITTKTISLSRSSSLPTKFLRANPTSRLNHRSSIYYDRSNLLCVRPHNKHCFWPGSHRNPCHEGVFVFCWTVGVVEFLPTQKRAGPRGELCALLVHRWVHKQPVLF